MTDLSNNVDVPLLAKQGQLAPALAGYPVQELVDVYAHAGPSEQARTLKLVDQCLGNWIESLDPTISTYLPGAEEAVDRIQEKQRNARDALSRVRIAIARLEVVRPDRGQLC
jgi:hypothetical protein